MGFCDDILLHPHIKSFSIISSYLNIFSKEYYKKDFVSKFRQLSIYHIYIYIYIMQFGSTLPLAKRKGMFCDTIIIE